MRKIWFACFASVLVLGMISITAAEEDATGAGQSPQVSDGNIGNMPSETLVALSECLDMWLKACLSIDDGVAEECEKRVLLIINHDIKTSEFRVRELARVAALSSLASPDGEHGPALNSETKTDHEAFEQNVAVLNTKELLYKSLTRTKAFSNKYRLVGDYIDLLRRELDMPRLKLATADSPTSSANSQGSR